MRKLFIAATVGLALGLGAATSAKASGDSVELMDQDWSWEGMFGTFNREDVKKGGQIFFEVCNGCHSMNMVAYRNLMDIGWTEDEAKAVAEYYEVQDGPNDEGEMFMRPGRLADRFVAPYPNAKAAAAAHGAVPPDLSVMTKARKGGPDYVYSLLLGYEDEVPEGMSIPDGLNFNHYFPGHAIAMGQPIFGESVEFPDGSTATLEEEAKYIVTFLAWAAEPELEERKALGLKVLLYLVILTAMLYALKHRIWARICLDEYTHGPYEEQYQADLDKHK